MTRDSLFRVKENQYRHLINELNSIPIDIFAKLEAKFDHNPRYETTDDDERRLLRILNSLQSMNKASPGTNGYKKELRNEIRGMINRLGAPAFFVTINPNDANNPLVQVLSGRDVKIEDLLDNENMSKYERQKLAADNPYATATFFHRVMDSFIHKVLRYGKKDPGLFGRCSGYYGMVEAQGKGTLHCHFLIWIDGHLGPHKLRDRLLTDIAFRRHMFAYLESLIKCEPPGTAEVVVDLDGAVSDVPQRSRGVPNPAAIALPSIADLDPDEFEVAFIDTLGGLVNENHWHRHNQTCWKYLKRGEPRDDAHCRMRMNGGTRAETALDDETHAILLRRLHPRINPHNDVLAFLTQSNNDVQFIGSGEEAKALIYYVTDYITKSSLPTHIGLSVLRTAMDKNQKKFEGVQAPEPSAVAKSLFVKCANGILGRTELSHPQVMSYIVGYGDHYTSHLFQKLWLGDFLRRVESQFPLESRAGDPMDTHAGVVEPVGGNDESDRPIDIENEVSDERMVTVRLSNTEERLTIQRQYDDYVLRSNQEPFSSSNLYRFVQLFHKVAIPKSNRQRGRINNEDAPVNLRARNPSGDFLPSHPQVSKQRLCLMQTERVPVVLGPTLAHPDKGDVAREEWYRAMLVLFKPWRSPTDLKEVHETWTDAFNRTPFVPEDCTIMDNMRVLAECRNARNNDAAMRRARPILPQSMGEPGFHAEEMLAAMMNDNALNIVSGHVDSDYDSDEDTEETRNRLATEVTRLVRQALGTNPVEDLRGNEERTLRNATLTYNTPQDKERVDGYRKYLDNLRKRKQREDSDSESLSDAELPPRRRRRVEPTLATTTLDANAQTLRLRHHSAQPLVIRPDQHIGAVIDAFHLATNVEQLRAFNIIADRVVRGGEQLLMYVGGVGGTGKSHLIGAVVDLFQRLGRRNELYLSAPTGAASVVIQGATIHSLTGLPGKKPKAEVLVQKWRDTTFLILDEISMVSAKLLHDVSCRISIGKGSDLPSRDNPFGGIHVLFTGDFGQLMPVGGRALFHNELVGCISARTAFNEEEQHELLGAGLWRQVGDVVLLRKNQRQAGDPAYAALLSRTRTGTCNDGRAPNTRSDYATLSERVLSTLARNDPSKWMEFEDAPVIVGAKFIRDEINRQRVQQHARKLDAQVHEYYSSDLCEGDPLAEEIQELAWRFSSTLSKDSLGVLPLFKGMKVMLTENIAVSSNLVNGAEGTVRHVDYRYDAHGKRCATTCYVFVEGCGVKDVGHGDDVVPVLPVPTAFTYQPRSAIKFRISRLQLPILPAYSYTDFKSQGRTLPRAIVDLQSARSQQGAYVMLSRVKSLEGIAIFRQFDRKRIETRLSAQLREELARLEALDGETTQHYSALLPSCMEAMLA